MTKKLSKLCLAALMGVASTTAWALSEVGGVYQIGTAADLKAFAELVNGGDLYANAILTADIDKGTDNYRIGTNGDYHGVFDGNGHTISYDITLNENGAGLFRNIGTHGVIKDLKVQGTITTNASYAGGIAGWNSGRILGCYVDVNIVSSKQGDATDGGMVGIAYSGTLIENCLVKVDLDGTVTENCGGVVGWANDKINIVNTLVVSDGSTINTSNGSSANIARNGGNLNVVNLSTYNSNPYSNRPSGANYNNYVTQQWGNNNATTVVPLADLADGKICYQLNTDQSKINWVQNIGTDPFPVPVAFGSTENQVYASAATGCNGKGDGLTYTNTPSNVVNTPHTFDKYGICTTCGCYNFDGLEFDAVDNAVLIKSADDLYLAEGWNRVDNGFKLNMKVTNDIVCIAPEGQQIFNSSNAVKGNFDGQGHTITIGLSDMSITRCVGFIPDHTGIFENVILHGTIKTKADHVGSISGHGSQKFVRNVYSDVTINTEKKDDNTSGGLFGIAYEVKTVDNCIYAGSVNGIEGTTCIAGFCGWASGATTYNNCAFLGTLNNAGGDSHTISRNNGQITCNNVYSLNEYNNSDAGKYIKTNAEDVASGKLAFLLNGSQTGVERFYQVIGTDPEPMPIAKEGGIIYAVATNYTCDGTPVGDEITYSNTASGTFPPHDYVDGFCANCGGMQEGYMSPVSGWYEIGTPGQLAWWSNYAAENPKSNARLTADIDMTSYNQHYVIVGSAEKLFTGQFDGQGHTISNLTISGGNYAGMFGVIGNGADIKNFVLDNTCSISGASYVGIIGGTNGSGKVYITNVGNEGPVTGTGANVSGIIGVDMGGAADMFITNCFVVGAIKGARESATICSWSSGGSKVENCYSIATLEGKYGDEDSFTRGSGACVNCYEIEGVGTQNNKTGTNRTNLITAAEVASGALCYKLNGEQGGVDRFYQVIGTDVRPKPFAKTGGLVFLAPDGYRCDGKPLGDVTYTNTDPSAAFPAHQFDADGICAVCGELEKDADGYMKIINANSLVAFTKIVNTDLKTATKARMYADVNMDGITDYYPIGDDGKLYVGEFDGQGHVISNLVINNPNNDYQGLFGRIGDGADIKNLVLDNTCSINAKAFAGVIGGTNGAGTVYITNVGNEGNVTGSAQNICGILGVDMGGSATLHITNCYVTGAIKGARESATICGWSNGNSVIKNCYSTATLEGNDNTFTRGGAQINNCFEIETVGTQAYVGKVTAEEVASGALAYKLDAPFGQLIGTNNYPVLNGPSVSYVGEIGYATLFDTTTGYELNGDVKAYVATRKGTWLALTEIESVPASTPVILTGAYYNKLAKNLPDINIANDLRGTTEDTAADGTMYVLAKPEGQEVGFYKATGTIPAGKAYYQSTSGIKAFYFEGDDATGIMAIDTDNDNMIYNLAGQRLQKVQKGINIIQGKKILK
jgi:hypothetical protein